MQHSSIKDLRRRLGWTQWDLAERLGVDQGTVSRWERGVEEPRPASAGVLRDLVLREDNTGFIKRYKMILAHSLQPAAFADAKGRLEDFNLHGKRKYLRDYGLDLSSHIGFEFERHADAICFPHAWECFQDIRFMSGEILLARFYANKRGVGHIAQYEPVFEGGTLAGFGVSVVGTLAFPRNPDMSVERVEVVRADAPERIVETHRGPLARFAVSA